MSSGSRRRRAVASASWCCTDCCPTWGGTPRPSRARTRSAPFGSSSGIGLPQYGVEPCWAFHCSAALAVRTLSLAMARLASSQMRRQEGGEVVRGRDPPLDHGSGMGLRERLGRRLRLGRFARPLLREGLDAGRPVGGGALLRPGACLGVVGHRPQQPEGVQPLLRLALHGQPLERFHDGAPTARGEGAGGSPDLAAGGRRVVGELLGEQGQRRVIEGIEHPDRLQPRPGAGAGHDVAQRGSVARDRLGVARHAPDGFAGPAVVVPGALAEGRRQQLAGLSTRRHDHGLERVVPQGQRPLAPGGLRDNVDVGLLDDERLGPVAAGDRGERDEPAVVPDGALRDLRPPQRHLGRHVVHQLEHRPGRLRPLTAPVPGTAHEQLAGGVVALGDPGERGLRRPGQDVVAAAGRGGPGAPCRAPRRPSPSPCARPVARPRPHRLHPAGTTPPLPPPCCTAPLAPAGTKIVEPVDAGGPIYAIGVIPSVIALGITPIQAGGAATARRGDPSGRRARPAAGSAGCRRTWRTTPRSAGSRPSTPRRRPEGLGQLLRVHVEAVGVEGLRGRHVADRGLDGGGLALDALDGPLEDAAVLAEARPQELAVLVAAEPVDVEDLRQLGASASLPTLIQCWK